MPRTITIPADPPLTGYVRQSQLLPAIVPFSAATLWRRVQEGTFPAPVKLSPRVTAWRIDDVRAWMTGRPVAARKGEVA